MCVLIVLSEWMFFWLQLQYGKDEDLKDKVEIVAILSMSDKEIDDALEIVSCADWCCNYFYYYNYYYYY